MGRWDLRFLIALHCSYETDWHLEVQMTYSSLQEFHGYQVEAPNLDSSLMMGKDPRHARDVLIKLFAVAEDDNWSVHHRAFLGDIKKTLTISSPNHLPILDSGIDGQRLYVVYQRPVGPSLRPFMRRSERLPLPCILITISRLCRAIHRAHQEGIFHLRLNPNNVYIAQHCIQVSDFGLRHLPAQGPKTPILCPEGDVEHIPGDIYGIGRLLYQLLTGVDPIKNDPHRKQELTPPHWWDPTLPQPLDPICATALAKDPQERYESPLHLADAVMDVARNLEERDILWPNLVFQLPQNQGPRRRSRPAKAPLRSIPIPQGHSGEVERGLLGTQPTEAEKGNLRLVSWQSLASHPVESSPAAEARLRPLPAPRTEEKGSHLRLVSAPSPAGDAPQLGGHPAAQTDGPPGDSLHGDGTQSVETQGETGPSAAGESPAGQSTFPQSEAKPANGAKAAVSGAENSALEGLSSGTGGLNPSGALLTTPPPRRDGETLDEEQAGSATTGPSPAGDDIVHSLLGLDAIESLDIEDFMGHAEEEDIVGLPEHPAPQGAIRRRHLPMIPPPVGDWALDMPSAQVASTPVPPAPPLLDGGEKQVHYGAYAPSDEVVAIRRPGPRIFGAALLLFLFIGAPLYWWMGDSSNASPWNAQAPDAKDGENASLASLTLVEGQGVEDQGAAGRAPADRDAADLAINGRDADDSNLENAMPASAVADNNTNGAPLAGEAQALFTAENGPVAIASLPATGSGEAGALTTGPNGKNLAQEKGKNAKAGGNPPERAAKSTTAPQNRGAQSQVGAKKRQSNPVASRGSAKPKGKSTSTGKKPAKGAASQKSAAKAAPSSKRTGTAPASDMKISGNGSIEILSTPFDGAEKPKTVALGISKKAETAKTAPAADALRLSHQKPTPLNGRLLMSVQLSGAEAANIQLIWRQNGKKEKRITMSQASKGRYLASLEVDEGAKVAYHFEATTEDGQTTQLRKSNPFALTMPASSSGKRRSRSSGRGASIPKSF